MSKRIDRNYSLAMHKSKVKKKSRNYDCMKFKIQMQLHKFLCIMIVIKSGLVDNMHCIVNNNLGIGTHFA